jgi:2-C-methyl-D-erythritol 4-phosphate cytidylyltransferase/2-C-methyl-D-erythritol 2,4-cyclodiphosphate synthase
VWTIVVAAGGAVRFGGPKQYAPLGGRRVVDWSIDGARTVSSGVVLVVPPSHAEEPEPAVDVVVAGAATRSGSVRAGLAAIPSDAAVVVVHDAARPLAQRSLFEAVVDAVAAGADAALPGAAMVDTVRRRDGGTLDRDQLVAVQTPQAFRAGALRAAHGGSPEATDDVALVEAAGGSVAVVDGDPRNRKITEPADLAVAEALLAETSRPSPPVRVGMGFDVHRFSPDPNRALVLGGVTFVGARGLEGHSDADAVAHACADALLGGAGLGDLGQHFPDTDPAWADADSLELLAEATRRVREAGWAPGNVDASLVADAPRIAPHRDEMQARLTAAVGAPVTVTGRRSEGLGAIGRAEGVACWAVALVMRQ